MKNPIVNGARFCGVTRVTDYGAGPVRIERRHTYGKHTAYGVRTVWKAVCWRPLGKFATLDEAKAAIKAFLLAKHQETGT